MRTNRPCIFFLLTGLFLLTSLNAQIAFPDLRPRNGNFVRPEMDQVLSVSPPGFSWWLAAPEGEASYRLEVLSSGGRTIYEADGIAENIHVPDIVFPAGHYTWTIEAYDQSGFKKDTREFGSFSIATDAMADPWTPPADLLARVPKEHPRLLYPKDQLEVIRATLKTTRKEAYENLIRLADEYLGTEAPVEPDYDEIEDRALRALAYRVSFREMRGYHLGAMTNTALAYLMTGKKEYGETAKTILLGATEWDPNGISSILAPYGDEIGLGLVKSEALTYDWIYDLLTPEERERVEEMIVARADEMVRRLRRRNFMSHPQESHNGRLPGYLIEHALVLAEHPNAVEWLDYALKVSLTVHPHWAGRDGGWAQGLAYGNAYNAMLITPLESLRIATGKNLWQYSFYNKSPYFWVYCMSPYGEIRGFGDSYQGSAARSAVGLRGLLQFHAERMLSSDVQWWVDLLRDEQGEVPRLDPLTGLIRPSTVRAEQPADMPDDAVFRGVGWAALHSDIANPEEDLLFLFKSSPYGGVSHSYNDQNGFQILCGGKVLARPGGIRFPHSGTPYHNQYTRQTMAHNAMLVNGEGQQWGGAPYNGEIVDFESLEEVAYVCGDATSAYAGKLKKWRRHVLLLQPSVICIIDDLEAPDPSDYQWLLHSDYKLELDEDDQMFTERRNGLVMTAKMFSPIPMEFSQSNEWPVDPSEGFPEELDNEPEKVWHFKASTKGKARQFRMATIMTIERPGESVEVAIKQRGDEMISLEYPTSDAKTTLEINLDSDADHILGMKSILSSGKVETFVKP